MDSRQGSAVEHRELCSLSRGSLDGRGVWGRGATCTCVAECLCRAPENITALLITCTPVQNREFKHWEKINKQKIKAVTPASQAYSKIIHIRGLVPYPLFHQVSGSCSPLSLLPLRRSFLGLLFGKESSLSWNISSDDPPSCIAM